MSLGELSRVGATSLGPQGPSLVSVDLAFPGCLSFPDVVPHHVFQDPGIGEVAEENNLAVPDTEDLDRRRREGLARLGYGPLRAYLRDPHLRVLGLIELCPLEVLQPQ